MDLTALPGNELVVKGLADLAAGRESVESLLVQISSTRLRQLGLDVPAATDPDLRLYALLQETHGDGAHSHYNALVRQLVSFQRALECER
jgi:hypothetical protein